MKTTDEDRLRDHRLNEVEGLAALVKQRDVAQHLRMSPLCPRTFIARAEALAEDLQELADAFTRDVRRVEAKIARRAKRAAKALGK